MAFVSRDFRWAEDPARQIRIRLVNVSGLHLVNNKPDKWKVFFNYESPNRNFPCRYYIKFGLLAYRKDDKEMQAQITIGVIVPLNQLLAHYMNMFGLPSSQPNPGEVKQLLRDVEDAIKAREKRQNAMLSQYVRVPEPIVSFIDRLHSDDEADILLDEITKVRTNNAE